MSSTGISEPCSACWGIWSGPSRTMSKPVPEASAVEIVSCRPSQGWSSMVRSMSGLASSNSVSISDQNVRLASGSTMTGYIHMVTEEPSPASESPHAAPSRPIESARPASATFLMGASFLIAVRAEI